MSARPTDETRQTVAIRCGGMCERCGDAEAVDQHHRQGRGLGGSRRLDINTAPYLVALCRGCHEWAERNFAAARKTGWRISRFETDHATEIPLLTTRGVWISLSAEGDRFITFTGRTV